MINTHILTRSNSSRPNIEPVLPLINIVFLLLIFFMLTGQMNSPTEQGIRAPVVNQQDRPLESQANKWLYLRKDGQLFYQGKSMSNLKASAFTKGQSITLFVDGDTTGDVLNRVFNQLAKINITNISVVTQRVATE